jgi:hypothetical protein
MTNHLKTGQNGPVIEWHSITGPFDFKTQIDHLNTGLVWYSDGHCISLNRSNALNFFHLFYDCERILTDFDRKTDGRGGKIHVTSLRLAC